MYKYFIRPILFLFDPEKVHHFIIFIIKYIFKIPYFNKLVKYFCDYEPVSLKTDFFGLKLKNPIGLAAGFDKNAEIFDELSSFGFSHIEIGTVTPEPQKGNDKPRLFRLVKDKALINRMGFNNFGVNYVVEKLKNKKTNIIIGGNIGKNTKTSNKKAVDDYEICFRKLYYYVDYFVINISCPNIIDLHELQSPEYLSIIFNRLTKIRKTRLKYKPILLKISPDLNFKQIDDIIEVSKRYSIDGFVISNTSINRNGLLTDKKIINKIGKGGLSGGPLKKKSTEIIKYISDKTNKSMSIIASGGITTRKDAIEKNEAGASLIQVYTSFIYEGPLLVKKLIKS
jgi:dihydroorotate dehydrogenase